MTQSSRESTATLLYQILYQSRSFQSTFENINKTPKNQAEIQAISYGVLRHYFQLLNQLKALLKKPFKKKDKDIEIYLLIAFFQLSQSSIADYAIVNETVKTIKKGKKKWAVNLVNGLLRNYCRNLRKLNKIPFTELPSWMEKRIKKDWGEESPEIFHQSNIHAPMSLRVNNTKTSTVSYKFELEQKGIKAAINKAVKTALTLKKPVAVNDLPNFNNGSCSVQDAAAQLAGYLLNPQLNDIILDACAAPGGKTGHILEKQRNSNVIACDIDKTRLEKVNQNLSRLGLTAQVKQADMENEKSFEPLFFDRILLDAPCSAFGIIRRHPDIKFLRVEEDIEQLSKIQQKMLNNCWTWLKPKGTLLYATCSILKQENEQQITTFLEKNSDASLVKIKLSIPSHSVTGLQILLGENNMDGFYYAKLKKQV